MATSQELSHFLSAIEKRAFKQAVYAVRDDDAALDIVQDAMIKLAEKYGDRPAAELPLIFTRILQNRIHDWFRRQKVRNTWVTLFSALGKKNPENDDYDPLEHLMAPDNSSFHQDGAQHLQQIQLIAILEAEISKLPSRQQEAFLMRYWEEFSITDTALAMGCSEGSVKTHCSRATQALAKALKAKGISL